MYLNVVFIWDVFCMTIIRSKPCYLSVLYIHVPIADEHALCIWKSNFELLLQNHNTCIQLNLNMCFYPLNTSEETFPLQENTSFWCLFLYAHPKWSAFKVYVFSNICFLNFKEFWTFLWRLIMCETTGSYLTFSLLCLLWKHI